MSENQAIPNSTETQPTITREILWRGRGSRITKEMRTRADMYILKQIREKTPMVFQLYRKKREGKITDLYQFQIVLDKKINVMKLDSVFYYKKANEAIINKNLRIDPKVVELKLLAERKWDNRFHIDNAILKTVQTKGIPIQVVLRSGHVVVGKVRWASRYDLALRLKGEVTIVIFRHAIYSARTPLGVIKGIEPKYPKPQKPRPKKQRSKKPIRDGMNLNTATLEQLQTLDRIGAAVAQRIIDHRPYEKIDELLNVSGIGEKVFELIKSKIYIPRPRQPQKPEAE